MGGNHKAIQVSRDTALPRLTCASLKLSSESILLLILRFKGDAFIYLLISV